MIQYYASDREIFNGPCRVDAVVGVCGNFHVTKGVFFDPEKRHG